MTEDRFWDLAEGGARCFVIVLQWLLIWPFALLGLVASGMEARRAETGTGSVHDSPTGEAGDAQP